MKFATVGESTSKATNQSSAEVTNISKTGLWVLLNDEEELFLAFDDFPWFRNATIGQITHLEAPGDGGRLHWPELDIDLSVESIRNPENFPLVSQVGLPAL